MIGSSEFVEKYLKSLYQNAVVYLNLDVAVAGSESFISFGSPSLGQLVREVTKQITFSDGKTMYDKWTPDVMYPLGSGSDFASKIERKRWNR